MSNHLIWTKESIKATAKEYTDLAQFRKDHPGAYSKACKLGIMWNVTKHMARTAPGAKQQLTIEQAKAIARKYTTKISFSEGDRSTYVLCCRYGWLEEVCEHMVSGYTHDQRRAKH